LLDGEMKPIAARVLITLIVLAFVIGVSVFVNSRFHGSFAAGINRARPTVSRAVVFFAVFATSPVPEMLRQNAVSFFETENRFATDVRLRMRPMH